MLQIKKKAVLQCCKYNLTFLFRKKLFDSFYKAQKQKTSTVLLRSPKHFNIGKQKITSLNYKTPTLLLPIVAPFNISTLFRQKQTLYNTLIKRIRTNYTLGVNSIRVQVRSKFKMMWLET